jgi:hypothetical protein
MSKRRKRQLKNALIIVKLSDELKLAESSMRTLTVMDLSTEINNQQQKGVYHAY